MRWAHCVPGDRHKRAGWRIEEAEGSFRVTLFNTPLFEGAGPEWQQRVEQLPLKSSQKRVLLFRPEGFTNEE